MLIGQDYSNIVGITTSGELHTQLSKYALGSTWKFRGQSDASWPLVPKAGRSPYKNYDDSTIFRHWKRGAAQFLQIKQFDEIELLAIAQHNGLPTRLLDWSHNPLVAAFFAVTADPTQDGALYAIKYDRFVTDKFEPFQKNDRIVLYQPTLNSPRLARQMGYFSLHNTPSVSITQKTLSGCEIDKCSTPQ